MKKQIVNLENKKIKDLEIQSNVFEVKLLPDLIHQYIRFQNAKARQGTHKTKSRSEVNGKAKKPFSETLIFLLSMYTFEPGFVLPKIKEPCSNLPLNSTADNSCKGKKNKKTKKNNLI